jgi:hypothetical protein
MENSDNDEFDQEKDPDDAKIQPVAELGDGLQFMEFPKEMHTEIAFRLGRSDQGRLRRTCKLLSVLPVRSILCTGEELFSQAPKTIWNTLVSLTVWKMESDSCFQHCFSLRSLYVMFKEKNNPLDLSKFANLRIVNTNSKKIIGLTKTRFGSIMEVNITMRLPKCL